MTKCKVCKDTGQINGSAFYDCTACNCASERVELENFAAEMPVNIGLPDELWAIHRRARQIEREAQAARIAELERRLEFNGDHSQDVIVKRDERIAELGRKVASAERRFMMACEDLGSINEKLGLDPDDGGAEPIIAAIEELQAAATARHKRPAWMNV